MAKQKGPIQLTGLHKGADTVFVSGKYKAHTRSAPKGRQAGPALEKQSSQSGYLNRIAGYINSACGYYAGTFKSSGFYHELLRRFRREPQHERVLLLDELRNMEINDAYSFKQICPDPDISIAEGKDSIAVTLDLAHHPIKRNGSNSYYMQVVLLVWDNAMNTCTHEGQLTEWIGQEEALPITYEMSFKLPKKAGDYIVACRCVVGRDNIDEGLYPMQGMKIMMVGSFEKRSAELLEAKYAAREEERREKKQRQPAKVEVRVSRKEGSRKDAKGEA